jgi:S1/P1 nuclease
VKLNCAAGVFCGSNLHSEWDGILGNTHNFDVVTSKGTTLDARPVPPGANISDPNAWADDSMALARSDVYKDPDGAALGDPRANIGSAYVDRARSIAETQVILAARRLAALLNAALGQ